MIFMAEPSTWEFYKEDYSKILWIHICAKNSKKRATSINKWGGNKISRIQNDSGLKKRI